MADTGQGDKTEKPTEKRLEDSQMRGQIARSSDLQTLAVLTVATSALTLTGPAIYYAFYEFMREVFSELHTREITTSGMQAYLGIIFSFILKQVAPIIVPIFLLAAVTAGMQSQFKIASKALELSPSRMNPIKGLKKIFGIKQMIPAVLGILKLLVIIGLTYSTVVAVVEDPIFFEPTDIGRLGPFIGSTTIKILTRICVAMLFIGILDMMYQKWQTTKDMMMSKQEIKDEHKSQEGNPEQKARQKQSRSRTFRQMLADVPTADAVITNPTHLAVAIKYDRENMNAPQIIAKGARNNALKIREVAKEHQIPIIEDKPVARMLFKYGKVGGEVPSQLFNAIAEILAYVYKINAYRYYRQDNEK